MKTTMLRSAMGAALVLAGLVHTASAQSSQGPDPTMIPVLKAEFDRAATRNVPAAPLIATARHGMIMGQPTSRIRDAVRGKADRYVEAREALSPVQSQSEIEAGADALQQKVEKRVLQGLRKSFPSRSLTMSLGVLQELVSKGVDPKQALATIERLLKSGESDTRIASLGTDMQGMLAQGLAPSRAFEAISKGVLSLPQSASGAALSGQRR
jgi:hypothetical protein